MTAEIGREGSEWRERHWRMVSEVAVRTWSRKIETKGRITDMVLD